MKHTSQTLPPANNLKPPVRSLSRFTALAFALFVGVSAIAQQGDSESEFKKLSESRKERKMLIDFLIKKNQAVESENGTLQAREGADSEAQKAIESENKTRLRMFELIAESEKKSPDQVAREFHAKIAGLVNPEKPKVAKSVLRLRGSSSIGKGIAPDLAAEFLRKKGYKNVKIDRQKTSDLVKVTGEDPKEGNQIATIEIHSSSSTAAFGTEGLLGKACDIGMSTRPIHDSEVEKMKLEGISDPRNTPREVPFAMDALTIVVNSSNPTEALSVLDLARLYCGYNREWSSVNGGNCNFGVIELFAREDGSGQWENFQRLVLDPHKKTFASEFSTRFVDNADIVRNVLSNQDGIGIVSISDINPKLRVLKIKPHDRGPERLPTSDEMRSNNYPLAYKVYFYLPDSIDPMAREFVNFTTSPEGQKIVDESRMIALEAPKLPNVIEVAQVEPSPTAPVAKTKLIAVPIKYDPVEPEVEVSADPLVSDQPPVTSEETKAAYDSLIKGADRKDTPRDLGFTSSRKISLNSESRSDLERLAALLEKPENINTKVVLIGFSDSRGDEDMNQRLSEIRAETAAKFLQKAGLKNEIVHDAFGESMPLTSNMLEEGRETNRRVEIWLQR